MALQLSVKIDPGNEAREIFGDMKEVGPIYLGKQT